MNKKQEIKTFHARRQIAACKEIIEDIKNKEYRDASVLIRFYLNDSRFIWYKDINSIIEDQISNLFIDIEQGFKNNYTIGFFEHIIEELEFDIKNGYL